MRLLAIFFLLNLLLAPNSCFGQSGGLVLTGYVSLQNSGGQPAYPASVQARGATTKTVRPGDGFFQLVFGDMLPGQDVEISVEKSGYEVVNREVLLARLPNPSSEALPLRIFLCLQGAWRRNADQYYETNQSLVIDNYARRIRSVQQRLSTTKTAYSALADTLAQLAAEQAATLELLKGYSEQLARTNLDDVTERYRLAFRLFTTGKMDSFLLAIREKDIRADLIRVEAEILRAKNLGNTGREKLVAGRELQRQTIQELLIRARALVLAGQWAEADRTFGIAVEEDPTNRNTLAEYYFFKKNRFQAREARQLAERLLAMPGSSKADSAFWWNETGRCYGLEENREKALACYQQSAALYKDLSKHVAANLIDYAAVLSGISTIYQAKGDYSTAQGLNEEALSLLERSARVWKPAATQAPISMISIGEQYLQNKDYTRAEAIFLRAGELMRKTADTTSREYLDWTRRQSVALTNVYRSTNRLNEAIAELRKLVQQCSEDARHDPGRYSLEYISMNAMLGFVLSLDGSQAEALQYLIYADSQLAHYDGPFLRHMELVKAQLKGYLGMTYLATNQLKEAARNFEEQLVLSRLIYPLDTLVHGDDLAIAYSNLFLYYLLADVPNAGDLLPEYIALLRRLAGAQPQKYSFQLAKLLLDAGNYQMSKANVDAAASLLGEAEAIFRSNPVRDALEIASCQASLGRLARQQRDWAKAEHYLNEAHTALVNLLPRSPANITESVLANVLVDLGLLYIPTNPVLAEQYLQTAIDLQRKLSATWSTPALRIELAFDLYQLGLLKSSYEQQDEAIILLEESIALFEAQALNQANSPKALTDQATVSSALGNCWLMKNEPKIALEKYQSALSLMETAAQRAPESEYYLKAALLPHLDLAITQLALDDSIQAEGHLEKCRILFEQGDSAPDNFKVRLAYAANSFGNFYKKKNNNNKALVSYLQAAGLYRSLNQILPPAKAQAIFNALQLAELDMQIYKDTRYKFFREDARDYLKLAENMAGQLPANFAAEAEIARRIKEVRKTVK